MTDLDRVYELAEAPTQNFIHQIIFVVDHAKDKPLLKEAGRVWGRSPALLRRVAILFPQELGRDPDFYELLSMYEMARLNDKEVSAVEQDWRGYTLSYQQVKEKVAGVLAGRIKPEKKVKLCPHCQHELP